MKPFSIFTTLVLVLSTIPFVTPSSAQAAGDLAIEDRRGDVSAFGFPTPVGIPASAATDNADLTSFRMYGEDIEGITIEIGVAELKPTPQQTGFFSGGRFSVSFMLEGTEISYGATFYVYPDGRYDPVAGAQPSGTQRIPADFYICVPESGCFNQRILGTVNWDESLITGYLPKGALAGREPVYDDAYPEGVPPIRAGSRLASIQVQAQGNLGLYDQMPDSGVAGPYILKVGVPNEKIGVSLVQFDHGFSYSSNSVFGPVSDFPSASVTPGTPTLVQVRVANHNAAKRIINISAQLVDPADAAMWSVRVVNTLTIPGGDDRIINLIVNATDRVQHRDEALARVSARSLGFPDEIGSLRVRLVAAVPPTPTKNILYAHTADQTSGGISFCLGGCGLGSMWLNTLEDDPRAFDTQGSPMSFSTGLTSNRYYFDMTLDAQLTRDLVFDAAKLGKVTLVTQCNPCPQGELTLELQSDQGPIASGVAVFASTTEVELTMLTDRVARGSYIGLFGQMESTGPPPFVDGMNPKIVGGETQIQLPVIADPEAKVGQRIPLGPAFLTLSADNATGQFIAPGKSKVIAVTVVNEGIEEDVVNIALEHEPEHWSASVQPGDKFRLKAGESATFGILVSAPSNATEGEGVKVLINATSELDETALAQLGIEATASENALDEEEEFEVDEDTELALQEAPPKSPGPGLVAFLAVAVALIVWRRRRNNA
ncbi:MAG TPA: hypothetical protein VGB18_03775 [Candidatus Thermoplasmatota archaeon]